MHTRSPILSLAGLAVATLAVSAQAAPITTYLRENNSAFNGNAVTLTPFDDTQINTVPGGTGSTTLQGTSSNIQLRTTSGGLLDAALIGVQNLFTLIPAVNGGGDNIIITDAKLHLYARGAGFEGGAGATVSIHGTTSDWMINAAGTNENDVSGRYREASTSTNWAVGNTFSTSDYAATPVTTQAFSGSVANTLNSFNVTNIVAAMFSSGINEGFTLITPTISNTQIGFRSSEQANATTPVLEITYDYVPVPEPASLALLSLGGLAFLARRRA